MLKFIFAFLGIATGLLLLHFDFNVQATIFHAIGEFRLRSEVSNGYKADHRSAEMRSLMELMKENPVPAEDPVKTRGLYGTYYEILFRHTNIGLSKSCPELPAGLSTDVLCGGLRCLRVQWPGTSDSKRVVLYIHGGGYVIGNPDSNINFMARLSRNTGAQVFGVDYRLAPEYPLPAAIEDSVSAYRSLLKQGFKAEDIIICGDSAGGGATLLAAQSIVKQSLPTPRAIVMMSPWADLTLTAPSYKKNAKHDPLINQDGITMMQQGALGTNKPLPAHDPAVSGLFGSMEGLPPMFITVGGTELLLDDSTRLAQKAKQAGVPVTLRVNPDAIHVWPVFCLPESIEETAVMAAWMNTQWDTRSQSASEPSPSD